MKTPISHFENVSSVIEQIARLTRHISDLGRSSADLLGPFPKSNRKSGSFVTLAQNMHACPAWRDTIAFPSYAYVLQECKLKLIFSIGM